MTDELHKKLNALNILKRKIQRAQMEINEFYSLIGGLTAIRYDTDRVQTSLEDVLSKNMAQLDEMQRRLNELRSQVPVVMESVTGLINKLEDEKGKTILYYRFISNVKFDVIANKMGYSRQNIYRIYGESIKNLERIE